MIFELTVVKVTHLQGNLYPPKVIVIESPSGSLAVLVKTLVNLLGILPAFISAPFVTRNTGVKAESNVGAELVVVSVVVVLVSVVVVVSDVPLVELVSSLIVNVISAEV